MVAFEWQPCRAGFSQSVVSFLLLWSVALLTELAIAAVAMRGTIFHDEPREAAEYLLYLKLGRFGWCCARLLQN